ncbi:hypothetical protein E2C01_007241 [Portunus trituberculatus]|uniref:Uncharacterized protein n=1 Tax=Portunus trituberculatus TaxID=210409 RepID=A0A5B7D0E4_PORTR|nr:hypothetical protein [Portunus trituberculatus]
MTGEGEEGVRSFCQRGEGEDSFPKNSEFSERSPAPRITTATTTPTITTTNITKNNDNNNKQQTTTRGRKERCALGIQHQSHETTLEDLNDFHHRLLKMVKVRQRLSTRCAGVTHHSDARDSLRAASPTSSLSPRCMSCAGRRVLNRSSMDCEYCYLPMLNPFGTRTRFHIHSAYYLAILYSFRNSCED